MPYGYVFYYTQHALLNTHAYKHACMHAHTTYTHASNLIHAHRQTNIYIVIYISEEMFVVFNELINKLCWVIDIFLCSLMEFTLELLHVIISYFTAL